MISARNQLKGTVKSIKVGTVMAEVVVKVGEVEIVAVITKDAVKNLRLKKGDEVTALVKATEVLIAKD